jgi:hypothetical protein
VLDAWSNLSKHHLHGNSFDFGDFYGCLAFNHDTIQPLHCHVQYQYKPTSNVSVIAVPPSRSPLNFYWKKMDVRFGGAVCVPDSCTADDVRDLVSEVFADSDFEQTYEYDQSRFCQSNKKKEFELDTLRVISM